MKTRQSFLLTVLTLLVLTMALAAVSAHASGGSGNNDGNYDGDHGGHHNNHGQLDCSQATPSKKRLWPANHKLKHIYIAGLSTSDGSLPDITYRCVYQDEPLNGLGDGNTEIDAKLTNDGELLLRKERASKKKGNGNGRVYHIDFEATDTAAGESCLGSVSVQVPHRRWGKAKDDGRLYVSLDNGYNCGGSANQPPVIDSDPITTATETEPYQYAVIAVDPESSAVTYTLLDAPQDMQIDSDGLISWLPALGLAGDHAVSVKVTDAVGASVTQSYTLSVTPRANTAPIITSTPTLEAIEQQAYNYQLTAIDNEGDAIGFSVAQGPQGLTATLQGLVQWTPTSGQAGHHDIVIEAIDALGAVSEQAFTIVVAPKPNYAPQILSTPVTEIDENSLYQYTVLATDPEGTAPSYQLVSAPPAVTLTANMIEWSTTYDDAGEYSIEVMVSDADGATASQTYLLTVHDVNRAPLFTSVPDLILSENDSWEYFLTAIDNDGDSVSFALIDGPDGLVLDTSDPAAIVLAWTPDYEAAGDHPVEISVSDNRGGVTVEAFLLSVSNTNRDPQISSTPVEVATENQLYNYQVEASDDDHSESDVLTYRLIVAPDNMIVDSTGLVSWLPDYNAAGDHPVEVAVSDGESEIVQPYIISVANVNQLPVANPQVVNGSEDIVLSVTLTATDNDGDTLTFTIVNPPANGSAVLTDNVVLYTPAANFNGTDSFTFTVNDGSEDSEPAIVAITLAAVNDAPVLDFTPVLEGAENIDYTTTALASDVDGDLLMFGLLQAPTGMTIDSVTGVVDWLPGFDQAGDNAVTVAVTDDSGASDTLDFIISVANTNQPPLASDFAVQTNEDTAIDVILDGFDSDGDAVSYTVVDQPANGVLSGVAPNLVYTPNANFNGADSFTYQVSDGVDISAVAIVLLTISAVNDAPVVQAIIANGVTEQPLTLDLSGVDVEGDSLSFAIADQPVNGSVTVQDSSITYVSVAGFQGVDSFTYTASDGELTSLPASIDINITSQNSAPVIVSLPVTSVSEGDYFSYTVDALDQEGDAISYSLLASPNGMVVDETTGEISWVVGSEWSKGQLDDNPYCRVPESSQTVLPPAIDSVMVVDGSGSNQNSWPWTAQSMAELHAELVLEGIGSGALANQYGFVGFLGAPEPKQFEAGLFGTISELYEVTFDGEDPGGLGSNENGHLALQYTLDTYPFRDNTEKSIIWVADEPQQGAMDNAETINQVTQRLIDSDVKVHAITKFEVDCTDGRSALGFDADGRGYIENNLGGFDICEADVNAVLDLAASQPDDFHINAYVIPAIATGGSAWNWHAVSDPNRSGPMRQALTRLMYTQSVETQQELTLADLVVTDISVVDSAADLVEVDITVRNRGLADVSELITVTLESASVGEIYGSSTLNALPAGASHTTRFALAGEYQLPLRATVSTVAAEECFDTNNESPVAFVSVAASDGSASDVQSFAIAVEEINTAPVINSSPVLQAPIGQQYRYQLLIDDDLGDDHQFTVSSTLSVDLDRDSGLLSFRPTKTDIGTHTILVIVTDLAGASTTQEFTVEVTSGYTLPAYGEGPSNSRAYVNSTYSFTPVVSADVTAQLSHQLIAAPAGMTVDPSSGAISWVPVDIDVGRLYLVTLVVSDQFGNKDALSFMVFGSSINTPPVLSGEPSTMATLGVDYISQLDVTDPTTREVLSVNYTTGIQGLTTQLFDPLGAQFAEEKRIATRWSRHSVSSLYPQHLPHSDYLCVNASSDSVHPGIPAKLLASASHGILYSHALAFPFIDSNGDGQITASDNSQVVYMGGSGSTTTLYAKDIQTGEILWSHEFDGQLEPQNGYAPAIADITGDGYPDIAMVSNDLRLFLLDSSDGSVHWVSSETVLPATFYQGQITLTDLEQDGHAEILVGFSVFDASGNRLLNLQPPQVNPNAGSVSPIYPVDIDLDGQKDLLQGSVVTNLSGEEIWRVPFSDGHTSNVAYWAFANFDSDPDLEMVIVERADTPEKPASMNLLDADGSILWATSAISVIGQPIVSDFNGDGLVEIFVSGEDAMFDHTGAELWRHQRVNGTLRPDGSRVVAADLQGNDRVELLLEDTGGLKILDSLTGGAIQQIGRFGGKNSGSPLLADFNHDGVFEIVHLAGRYIEFFSAGRRVENVDLPSIVNQHWVDQRGLEETLVINTQAIPNFSGTYDQLLLANDAVFRAGLPDFRVSSPRGDYKNQIQVDVSNRGTADYIGDYEVQLFAGDPASDGVLLASQEFTDLAVPASEAVIFEGVVPDDFVGELVARVNFANLVQECQTNNNIASAHTLDIHVSDHANASDTVSYLMAVQYRSTTSLSVDQAWQVEEGQLLTFDVDQFFDHIGDDNNVGYFYLDSEPEGMTIDIGIGIVSWRPQHGQAGSYTPVIHGQTLNALNTRSLSITVTESPNTPPQITSQPDSGAQPFQPFVYNVEASDIDGDTLTYSLLSAPAGMTIDPVTGLVQWTPSADGLYEVIIVVSDGIFEDQQILQINVVIPNSSPVITSEPGLTALVDQQYVYSVIAYDTESQTIDYGLASAPAGMQIDSGTGEVTWTPDATQVGVHSVEITVVDSQGLSGSQSYFVSVSGVLGNAAPEILSLPPFSVINGETYSYNVIASDSDGDALTYQLLSAPAGMSVDLSGLLTWDTALNLPAPGEYAVVLSVGDGQEFALQSFSIWVIEDTGGAVTLGLLNNPLLEAFAGTDYQYLVAGVANHGGAVEVLLMSGPAGMTITPDNVLNGFYQLRWTPDEANCKRDVVLELRDILGNSTQVTFTIDVYNAPKLLNRYQCSVDAEFCPAR